MGVSREQLQAIIGGKARELCSPSADSMLNEVQQLNRNNGYLDDDPSNYDGDAEYFDSLYSSSANEGRAIRQKSSGDIQFSSAGLANSKMDDRIKKSLMENPIDRSSLNPNSRSVLDDMDIKPKQRPQRQQVVEHQSYGNQPSVDYSIIKAIVNECLNEYFSKQPLNESATLSTIGLKEGIIKLVDNKGNIYSANLKKIGNKNSQS